MRREDLDTLLRRLHWSVLRPIASLPNGGETSRLRGPGMELAGVREYQPGDDVRHIDWNITARAGDGTAFIREAYQERGIDIWLLVDASPSVAWGTARCLKSDIAEEFVAAAAQVLGRHGNRVGALLFAARPLGFLAPGAGRDHLVRLLAGIRKEPAQGEPGRTDLAAALGRTEALLRRPSLVVIVSDLQASEGWQPALKRLALRHEVVVAFLRDPREGELPDVGLVTVEDSETGEQLTVDTGDARLRERFQQAAQVQQEYLRTGVMQAGAEFALLRTDRDLLPQLVAFLERRRLARAGAMR